MKSLVYSEIAKRWEIIRDFKQGRAIAFNWHAGLDRLVVSRSVAHPSYKEASEFETQELIRTIFYVKDIEVWTDAWKLPKGVTIVGLK